MSANPYPLCPPPEPNGYLHIGHAKSICLNFGIAREFGGVCNLRMDDTKPTRVTALGLTASNPPIRADVRALADKLDRLINALNA